MSDINPYNLGEPTMNSNASAIPSDAKEKLPEPEEIINEFELDEKMHRIGSCSFGLLALCSAEEQRIKLLMRDIITIERNKR